MSTLVMLQIRRCDVLKWHIGNGQIEPVVRLLHILECFGFDVGQPIQH